MPYTAQTNLTNINLGSIICWTGADSKGQHWNVITTEWREYKSAQDDAETISAALNEHAVLIQALREIEILAAKDLESKNLMLIYSKACAALNYAEVTE